jgi:hypothetical protein
MTKSTIKKDKSKVKRGIRLPRFVWFKQNHVGEAILINGKIVVFILCSVISSLINLVFISNLTKESYDIGSILSIPAAIFLGILSVGLDASKTIHVIQVNSLNEMYRKLSQFPWSKSIKKTLNKWTTVYLLYVVLSIITSVSLSTISIGAGITRNANLLNLIDTQIKEGEKYLEIDGASKDANFKHIINSATDSSEEDAITFARNKITEIWPFIEEYKTERASFIDAGYDVNSTKEIEWDGNKIIPSSYWDKRNRDVNNRLTNAGHSSVSGSAIMNLNRANVERVIQQNQLSLTETRKSENAIEKLNDLSSQSMQEALGWISTINSLKMVNPKTGEITSFDIDETNPKVSVSSALTQLKALRVDVESDSGDIGSSSKIFMQVGSWIDGATEKKSDLTTVLDNKNQISFGTVEILMMVMLLFLSLLCELAINQFAPTIKVSRKMLGQFRHCLPKEFDINLFMLNLNNELRDYDLISDEELEYQIDYCNKRLKSKKSFQSKQEDQNVNINKDVNKDIKVESLVQEIEDLIHDGKGSN